MTDQTLQYRATSDSVTLYWEKPVEALHGTLYTVLLDGVCAGETDRTHFTLEGVGPDTAHTAEVRRGDTVIGTVPVRTEKARRHLNVRDHGAAGDGETMDTAAIQSAINKCGAGEEVYFVDCLLLNAFQYMDWFSHGASRTVLSVY